MTEYETDCSPEIDKLTQELRRPQLEAMNRSKRAVSSLRLVVFVLVLTNILSPLMVTKWFLERSKHQNYAIVLDESGTFYKAPLYDASDQEEIIVHCGLIGAWGMLNRNPNGLDYEKLMIESFGPRATARISEEVKAWKEESAELQIHQKVEVQGYEMLRRGKEEGRVMAQLKLKGQLIQTGTWGGREERRTPKFELTVKMEHNPRLLVKGRFPWAIADYRLWVEEGRGG